MGFCGPSTNLGQCGSPRGDQLCLGCSARSPTSLVNSRGWSSGCVLPADGLVAAFALWSSTKPCVSQERGEEEPRLRDVPGGLWEREGSSFGTSPAAA